MSDWIGTFYQAMARACQGDTFALQELIVQLSQAGLWREAARVARYMVAVEPVPNWQYCHNLAAVLRQIGAWPEAERWVRRALVIERNAGISWSLLGRLLAGLERQDEAIEAFRTSQMVAQPDPQGFAELLRMLAAAGRFVEADVLARHRKDSGDFVMLGGMDPHFSRSLGEPAALFKHRDAKQKWHRPDEVQWFPMDLHKIEPLEAMIRRAVIDGMPPSPKLFDENSQILTFGSCFANEIRASLIGKGITSATLIIPEGLNNTFALSSFIEWSLTGTRSEMAYWYDNDTERGALRWEAQEEQGHYAAMMKKTQGFIITLGLSEVWRDRETGGIFWRGVPDHLFSAERHELILSNVSDNADNIRNIYNLIQEHCGDRPVIVTVSPIPLTATFRQQPCLVADAASKSILRAAVEQVMQEGHKNLYYWPSFEVVRWLGAHLPRQTFGTPDYSVDIRHVPREIVDTIVKLFMERFFV